MASGKSYIDAERHSDRNSLEKYLLMQGIKNTFNDRYVKSVVSSKYFCIDGLIYLVKFYPIVAIIIFIR